MSFTLGKCSISGFYCTVVKSSNDNIFSLEAREITGDYWELNKT